MYINNVSLSNFGAKLLSREISSSDIQIQRFWARKALKPFISKNVEFYYKSLKVELEFKGTPGEIERNKSLLIDAMAVSTIRFETLDNYYSGSITGTSIGDKPFGFEVLGVEMDVYEHEQEEVTTFTGLSTETILLLSNSPTPVILELTPTANIATLHIEGFGEAITLSNLTAGTTVVINGEIGKVTENGINKYADYDSWGFPKLIPGENLITLSESTLSVLVRFSPRWR